MQVRAGSLQELVYKQGQAGVSKASVSIVFSNSDKLNSPVGYEQYDQITVTRQVRWSAFAQSTAPSALLTRCSLLKCGRWHVQLVIGGRNKYLINGHVAQPRCVQSIAQ